MIRIHHCNTATKTDLSVMQGAYFWCLATLQGKVVEQKRGPREYRCTPDSPHGLTLLDAKYSLAVLAPNPKFITDSDGEDWFRFQSLVKKWRNERGAMSSITEMALTPAYQEIIGMGEKAIPLILAELKSEANEPDQWFWALKAITGENPVREDDQGDFPKMAQAWLKWAENEGYAW
jgi:hypothetical protein